MTTPAQNQNIPYYGSGTRRTQVFKISDGSLQSDSTVSLTPKIGHFTKVRPESGPVPPDSTGWRKCKAWTHSGRDWSIKGSPVVRTVTSGNYRTVTTYTGAGSFWGFVLPGVPSLPNTNMKNRAEVKALNDLKNQDINLGQFLAEADKTIELVARAAIDIARQVKRFKRRFPRDWRKVKRWQTGNTRRRNWGKIPRRWLELQYGWRPLMQDIIGAMEYLTKIDRGPLIHADGKVSDDDERMITIGSGYAGISCKARLASRSTVFVNLWYELNLPLLAEVSSLGLLNPAELCWELTSYSFVVDWFLPIGPWLSALTADAGFTFKGGSCSSVVREYGKGSGGRTAGDPANTVVSGALAVLEGEAFAFSRTCYTSSPVPGFYVKNPLSLEHVLNGLALLSQAFR